MRVEGIEDLGDRVLAVVTFDGVGRGSGVEVEMRWAILGDIHGGKTSRMAMYNEVAEALEAAGLSE